MLIDAVDPFIGTDVVDLAAPSGLAASWWWPKPAVGNTHPGAAAPFGMVSASAYGGGYPTGYGSFERSTEGLPHRRSAQQCASGFTHFQQSGTGAIRKYYNYLRVTPMLGLLDDLGEMVPIVEEHAGPGWYRALLANGIEAELTVGPKSAVHRYTFPSAGTARIVVDCSHGGLTINRGATVPLRASIDTCSPSSAAGEVVMEGVPIGFHVECTASEWRQMMWYDRRLMPGGSRLEFDSIRPTTLRPFGMLWTGSATAGETVEVHVGFSLRGPERAERNLRQDLDQASIGPAYATRRERTVEQWTEHLDLVTVECTSPVQRSVFATALYHSLIKPCFAPDESPFWRGDGPFVFDICTMWDIYRTQLPLISALFPSRAAELANALTHVCEQEGNFPIGYRMARGADQFFNQGSALAHTFLADLCTQGVAGVDWDWVLCHIDADLRRQFGEAFIEHGVVHPITHTLDLAAGHHGAAIIARHVGDAALAQQFEALATNWSNAYDPESGLVVDSTFYEGGRWNYSFRLMHDMAGRIAMAGGEDRYTELLDRFFGFGAPPVKQMGVDPEPSEVAAGYALERFEGMNNEPDMEAPWSYHYVGRPDRTADVVHAALTNQFGAGRGGLPGNDDSGGLSSWYVWASLGLFPVAGQQQFLVNAPAFANAALHLDGDDFTITTNGFVEPEPDRPAQYVQAAWLDGQPLEHSSIPAHRFHGGGHLHVDLGPQRSAWATTTRPSTPTDKAVST